MKYFKIFLTVLSLLLLCANPGSAQDNRTLKTKVADLLAQFPAQSTDYTDKLMNDMLSLGDAGIKQICDQIVPVGSGDDTRPRFAVESLSRYLSKSGDVQAKEKWEQNCISYAKNQKDYTVKDFFMKQLQLIGTDKSVEAMTPYLHDVNLCAPAVAVIGAVGGDMAEKVLSEALSDKSLSCAASVMNTLARMKSGLALNEFVSRASDPNVNIRAAAYNALAQSGNPAAFNVLSKAAKSVRYRWDHAGAVASLLVFAKRSGEEGDVKTMDRICKTVLAECNDRNNIQYSIEALTILTDYYGYKAMPYLLKATENPDKSYRNSALQLSLQLKGTPVTREWVEFFPKANLAARPEIINMLGERKDTYAVPLVAESLFDSDINVRKEAASALVKISGQDALPALISYMMKSSEDDQESAREALKTILDANRMPFIFPALKDADTPGKKSAIELLAWSKGKEYFSEVLPFTGSENETLRTAAFKALPDLSAPENQAGLISLLDHTDKPAYIADIQVALANAANQVTDSRKRSAVILRALQTIGDKKKLIPVLAMTGGNEALSTVLKEFENGNSEMRDVCFKALTSWSDYSASSALFEICASRNKTYEAPAFTAYIKLVHSAPLTDDQRLLLFRKIMPYALNAERKNRIINELGGIKTYQCLFFTARYLNDPETGAAAANSVMLIALPSADTKTGMYGNLVREILTRAIPLLRGPESEYNKELISNYLETMSKDEGFVSIFNGKDLTGWQGLVENPIARAGMKPAELAKEQAEANRKMMENWSVKDGCIWFNGAGDNLCTIKQYSDFEMIVDWKITKKGDSGIYLRGSPQVQIWDTSRVEVGAQVGSGGLYNNQKNRSKPLNVADNPVGDWNSFRIIMVGDKVSVWLNGVLEVDDVVMENYWDRSIPIFPEGPIELQAHGTDLGFRDIYVREINEEEYNLTPEEKSEGFVSLFNGRNLDNWVGDKQAYVVEDGMIVVSPSKGSAGNLYTAKEYQDFIFRFEFQLTPAANNGLGIRAPLTGDAAYVGMELQILDNTAPVYANLEPYQYHGSVYGVIPARRGYLRPVGQWNYEEVTVKGTGIRIVLNGTVIVDGDIAGPRDNGTMDHRDHPGLKNRKGHIGFLGHGSVVRFKDIRIKDLNESK